ncbi:hybrid sensor histidine kinase/response regulator [Chitinophaga caseinilytica]|uniref:hybrid sensor histidine kinase/response regulator n=1 Tax=Chitinophaga caseinilytica TaxID=2267521 RepID=UPI003C2C460B
METRIPGQRSLLKDILQRWIHTGTTGVENPRIRRGIVIINTLSLLTAFLIAVVASLLYWYTGSLLILVPAAIECACWVGVIYLNHSKRYSLANLATLVIHCTFAVYFGSILGNAMPIEMITAFLLTFLIGASFIVFKHKTLRLITLLAALTLLLAVEANHFFQIVTPIYVVPANMPIIKMACWAGMLALMGYVTYFLIRQNDMFLRENEALLQALQEADAAKTKFLRETSHEIRTPLNAVFGIAQLLNERKMQIGDPALREEINYLYAASYLSREIINNVLDLAKIEAGMLDEPHPAPLRLRESLEASVAINRYVANTRNVRIQLRIDPQLPEWVLTDRIFLAKIVNNLLSNAVKFAPAGSLVEVEMTRQEGRLQGTVRNDGTIRADKLASMFQPFVAERNGEVEGTGLGLQITRQLTERLGGEVAAENQLGQTVFRFYLPLAAAEVPKEHAAPVPRAVRFDGYTVLVVEDDLISRHVLQRYLSDSGAVALMAESGEEGLRMLAVTTPDLVISDSHLPGIQGAELLEHIRRQPALRHLPVIISSGDAFNEARESMLRLGASDYLVKPFLYSDLQSLLEKHLPVRRAQIAQ